MKEKELSSNSIPTGPSELSRLQEEVSESCEPVLRQGYEILETAPGAKVIKCSSNLTNNDYIN